MKKREFTDFKRNNKVALRNFSESNDKHDTIKLLLVRMLRRNHPDNNKVPIYTEYDPTRPNEDYPDVWMRIKQDIYVYEIQNKITKEWENQILEKYEEVNLIVINMKKLSNDINKMKKELEVFLY